MRTVPIILLLLTLTCQGCGIGILAAGVGYAVSSNRDSTTKQKEAQAKVASAYSQYKVDMERVNLEREKAGLQPSPIQSYPEWAEAQGIPIEKEKSKAESKPVQESLIIHKWDFMAQHNSPQSLS